MRFIDCRLSQAFQKNLVLPEKANIEWLQVLYVLVFHDCIVAAASGNRNLTCFRR